MRRLVAVATLALFAVLATASPASAHAALLLSSPPADTGVTASPKALILVFGEAVSVTPNAVTLTGSGGHPAPLGTPLLTSLSRVVTTPVDSQLGPGIYLVHWVVTSTDGDLVDGTFPFGVGDSAAIVGASLGPSTPWDRTASTAVLRWALFGGLALALGGLAGERIASQAGLARPAWIVPGALVIVGSALALGVLLVAQTGTSALNSPAGHVLIAETVGGALVAAVAVTRWRRWALLPLALVVGAEGLRSHVHEAGGLDGAVITAGHLTAAAAWIGALGYVLRTTWSLRGQSKLVRRVLAAYARLAILAFLALVATGVLAAMLLVNLSDLTTTGYGRVLLVKGVLVMVAAALALTARIRLQTGAARTALVPARAELVVLLAILAASGLLVSFAPPSAASAALPFAPPPLGVVVPVATRAGQVGVAARASDGQLLVELTAPGTDTQALNVPAPATQYGLSGLLGAPGLGASDLRFRGCGSGCYVAPATWRSGESRLTLAVTASGWAGGTVTLLVPWPGRPDPALLARVTQVMSGVASLTVYETVTSDTGRPDPTSVGGITLTGKAFVASEPYSGGIAPITTLVEATPGSTRLLLAYPADQYTVDLTIDAQGRIQHETLTTANHLVVRTLTYPETTP